MAQTPVAKEVAHRFAELVGRGLTQHEAARVVEIGTRTGERLMTKPEIRQVVEQTRAASDGDPAIWALLRATDEEGNPDWERRLDGVELALADLPGESGGTGGMLPGVTLHVFPRWEDPVGALSG